MSSYFDCWIRVAADLFRQALAGEPDFAESKQSNPAPESIGWTAVVAGDEQGRFSVSVDASILGTTLLGEGVSQREAWGELIRESFEAACGELLAGRAKKCRIEKVENRSQHSQPGRGFTLRSGERSWSFLVCDGLSERQTQFQKSRSQGADQQGASSASVNAGIELLLDVELEVSLRFGCREMPLGEVLDLGPGDVVQLDRHVSDPVDLIVGDKIVARGEVVLVNGNFGLRVSEVSAPQKRLESIRCLF